MNNVTLSCFIGLNWLGPFLFEMKLNLSKLTMRDDRLDKMTQSSRGETPHATPRSFPSLSLPSSTTHIHCLYHWL
ncbi:hypothetical protein N7537_009163 [Penicillium hordei]|uniref:Uncharacterized protein n=1 Tax=Penicillium hordei TaxID=40994 RepID=A0AAD6GXH4_9EURO|nr:uncharacterized protein N7537_009163 [Penicillium hordei]KAJ5592259.1 hypothetical protein N7537_009163 [Penicillium hordei]